MRKYIALLRKDKDSDFGVNFPDFPGCVTAGKTLEEAHKFAVEALQFHIKGMVEDGEAIPESSSLDEVMDSPEHKDAIAFLVAIPEPKSKRVNITLPETALKAIDARAKKEGQTRSSFLLHAAEKALAT